MGYAPGDTKAEVSERDLFAPADLAIAETPPLVHPPAPTQPTPDRRVRIGRFVQGRAAALGAALALEGERGGLALLAPVGLGVGALAYFRAGAEPAWLHLLSSLAALTVIAWKARERPGLHMAAVLLMLAVLGAAAAKLETWRAGTRILGGEISTRITGRVVDIDHLANRRIRLVLDVLATERPKLRYQPQRVRVTAAGLPGGVIAGSVVQGLAQLHPPSGPIRPESYDFAFQSYFAGVGATGFFLGRPVLVTDAPPAPLSVRLKATADNIRNLVAERIRSVIGGAEGEIAAALIVGVRAGIPEPVNEALRRTGLAHILSISGLHMALVAASVMVVLRLGMALVPGFAATHPTKKYAAGTAIVVLAAYLFVSGFEVAAVRSFLMLAVMLTAVLFDRQALTMRNLAIAAILVLLVTPHEIVGPSFQMSFAATAALIGGYALWSGRRRRTDYSPAGGALWRRAIAVTTSGIGGAAATAIIAGLATGIYGVWHFQRISPLTLLANLAVTPIVSFIVMPFALLSAAAMPFGLDGPFLKIMGAGLSAMLVVTDYLSQRSPVDAVGMISGLSVALVTVALLIATLATTRLRLLALPFLALGVIATAKRDHPDIFIAEDARLVGVRSVDGELIVNRDRPNRFTVEGWQRAIATESLVKPKMLPDPSTASGERLSYSEAQEMLDLAAPDGFQCKGPLCVTRLPHAGVIAVAANAWTAQQVCRGAALVVVQSPRSKYLCGGGTPNLITARILARYGAATVSFREPLQEIEKQPGMEITYAVSEPYRPWHDHRRFSREARGLEAYRRPAAKPRARSNTDADRRAGQHPKPSEEPGLPADPDQ